MSQGVEHDGKLSTSNRRSSHKRLSSLQYMAASTNEDKKEFKTTSGNKTVKGQVNTEPNELMAQKIFSKNSRADLYSNNSKRPQPVFRKATEEVKRLAVKRKKITKRITTKEKTTSSD